MKKGMLAKVMRKPGMYRLLNTPRKDDKYVMVEKVCSKHTEPITVEIRHIQMFYHANVCISLQKLIRLENGWENIVTYEANERWKELLKKYNEHPSNFAVRFYCVPSMLEFATVVKFASTYRNNTQIIVRI